MYESLLISLSLITLISFLCIRKKLYPLENIFLWFEIVFILVTYFDVQTLNYKHIDFPSNIYKVLTIRCLELSVFPIVIITCINFIQFSFNKVSKIFLNFLTVLILISLEYLLEYLTFLEHHNWTVFNSYIFWQIIILISYFCQKTFNKILLSEVKS
jgi:hypothetical protein